VHVRGTGNVHTGRLSCVQKSYKEWDQTNVLDLPLPWKSLAFTTSTILPNNIWAFPLDSDPCFWRSWPGLPLAPHYCGDYQQSC